MAWGKNYEGKFNTMGQTKCPHCGLYSPDNVIDSHISACRLNPENQED